MKIIYLSLFILIFLSIDAKTQCYPDRHSTSWFDGWISCETATNPNDAYEASHWILYDLGDNFEMGESHFWNSNDPSHLDYGMQEVSIDYSIDGADWINLGTFDFEMASGKSLYEGFEGPDFGGVTARYLLLTGLSNYGGNCYGLSEIRIALEGSSVQTQEVQIEMQCASSNEGMLLEWTVDGNKSDISYIIERSDDANEWQRIKETDSYNLGDGKHTFHYVDNENLDQSAYYRIISIYGQGDQSITNDHYCSSKGLDARIYPNPMSSDANLEVSTQLRDEVQISIVDVLGKQIFEHSFYPNSLTSKIELGGSIVQEGQYFVSVRQGEEVVTVKLVKM